MRTCLRFDQQGFSLVEVVLALALAGLVSLAMYSAFASQNRTYINQEQVAGMQQNLRAAFDLIERDLRMAGFAGEDGANAGIPHPDSDRIVLTFDLGDGAGGSDPDGDVTDSGEYVTYSLYTSNGIKTLGRKSTSSGINRPVASNIIGIGFAYAFDTDGDAAGEIDRDAGGRIYWGVIDPTDTHWHDLDVDNDGQITPADDTDGDGVIAGEDTGLAADPADIRGVRVWLLAEASIDDPAYQDATTYQIGSRSLQPANNRRHRLLSSIVYCRNMGL